MLTRIRKLLAPPVFEGDEDKTRAAEILNTILLAILAGAMLASPLIWIASSEPVIASRLIATAILVLLTLALLTLMRRGYLAMASATLVIGIWAIITLAIVIGGGGVRSLGFPGHIILVLIAGILLGRRAAVATAGLSVLTGLAFVYARSIGAVSNPSVPDTDQEIWVIQSVYLGSAALLLGMALRSMERAFARARQELAERRQAEEALRRSKIELEQHNASLRIINEIAAKLHRSLDLQQIAAEAVNSLVHYSQSPMVAFFLLDKPASRLKVLAQYGFNSTTLAVGSSLPLQGSLSGLAVRSKSVTASEDIREDERVEPAVRQALVNQGLQSGVSIPILFQEDVLGVVNLIFTEKYVMSDYQRDTLISIGQTIGLAVANAQHVTQIESEITERQRAEEELQANEARFRALIENSRDIILVLDLDGTIRYASPSVKRMMGYALDEFVGRNVLGFIHQEDMPRMAQEWMHARQSPNSAPVVTEARIRHADGSWHVHEGVGANLFDNPAVKGFVMNSRDITERKRAEEELQSSEQRFRSLAQAAFEGIMIHEGGVILDTNMAFANLFGYPDVEYLIGKNGLEVLPFSPESREKIRQAMSLNSTQSYEIQVVRPDGTSFPAETQGREIVYRGRRARVVAMRDITERKRAEEQIRRQAVEMTALYETTHDLVIEQDLAKLLHTIVERAARLLGASGGGLYLCEPEQRQVRCVVSYNTTPYDYAGVILKYGEGAAGIVAKTGEPLIIDNYRAWQGRAAIYEQDQPFVSVLSVPMRWQDHVIGVIHVLDNTRPRAFTQEDLQVVTLFANQAAIAVENARLFETEQRRRGEAGAIAEVGRDISATLQLDRVLERIAFYAKDLLRAETSAVYLSEPTKPILRAIAAMGPEAEEIKKDLLKMGEGILGHIADQKAGEIVNDTATDPRAITITGTEMIPHEHLMAAPVLARDQLTGLIAVWRIGNGKEFRSTDLDFLSSLAGQVAVAIENARLFEETQKRLREMEGMVQVSAALSHTLELEPLLEDILQAAIHAIPAAERGSILLTDEKGNLHIRATQGYSDPRVRAYVFSPDSGYATLAFGERRAIVIPDVRADARIRYTGDIPEMLMGGSAIAAPLIVKDRVMGVIAIDTPAREDAFSEGDLHWLTAMSASAALVIENARLFDQARRRADEFAALYETARELADTPHVPTLLQVIVNRAAALFAAPSAAIFLHDPVRHDLELACSFGLQLPTGARLAWGEGLAGQVAQTRQPLSVDDYHAWPDRSPQFEAIPFSGDLQVPMLYHGELIGVLGVSDIGPTTRRFTEGDARLLALFAAQAATTVHDARLLETLEQRVAERTRELAEANERLTELDQLKSKFVSDVSHELRTPVTNLNLYLNLLERGKLEKRAEYMTVLRQQGARLAQLIEDILDLSRLEAGAAPAVSESLDLNALAAQVVVAQQPSAEAKGLVLNFEPLEENLPAIRGVANQLTQVITNLVVNALNYTRVGAVTVSTWSEPDRVLLQVQDTGPGIDPEDLSHLFERFYRGRRTAQSTTPGTGLGLTIVKEIIEAHGGQIEVESRLGQGSNFRVWLPIT